ncbi:MAG: CPBP family intramembrane metalloprotease [Coriobacteriales bacterium]|nr:CPBP family intramembrane metalloprotease [Coriobacteriales bacterium]
MDRSDVNRLTAEDPRFPWVFFAAIFLVSVPFWVLGAVMSVRLLPGLPLSALMFVCPAGVSLYFANRSEGRRGVATLLRRVLDFARIRSWSWYLPMLLLMPCIMTASWGVMLAVGRELPAASIPWGDGPLLAVAFFITAACEEMAWSGSVLEPMQKRMGALSAAIAIGLVWGVWHAIPYAQANPSAAWVLGQIAFSVSFRVLLAWVYFGSGSSLFAAIVCHASYNVAWQLFPNHGSFYDPWIAAALTAAVAVVVAGACGPRTLCDRRGGFARLSGSRPPHAGRRRAATPRA